MKFLIASVGNRLNSFVAKRFEHAAWYLVVDDDANVIDATQHLTPHDRHEVLLRAASEGVELVVAGKFGESSMKLIRSHHMRLALVHGISASLALEKIRAQEIQLLDADEIREGKGMLMGTVQRLTPKIKKPNGSFAASGYSSDSARGHHHLQQYGGRGH